MVMGSPTHPAAIGRELTFHPATPTFQPLQVR